MTRKTQVVVLTAAALLLLGGAVSGYVLRPPPEEPAADATLQTPEPAPVPADPALREQFRQAYRASLVDNSPPGMLELLSASEPAPAEKPPSLPPLSPPAEALPEVRLEAPACLADAAPVGYAPVLNVSSKASAPRRPLPLTGTHAATLDPRGTLVLSPEVRDQLGAHDTVLLTPGEDGCVWLIGSDGVDRLAANLARAAGKDGSARRARRLYFARTERAAVDAAGRVTLPARLAEHAGLCGDMVVVGADDRFEVWDARRWEAHGRETAPPPLAVGWQRPDAAGWREP